MTQMKFGMTVPLPPGAIISAALGVSNSTGFNQNDVGKCVKMAANDNYIACAAGDAIEGFVTSVEPGLVNNGFTHGGVLRHIPGNMRMEVMNAAATALVFGDYVKAAAQAAINTANPSGTTKNGGAGPVPQVQKGDGTEKFAWRVISLIGSGAQGTMVLIEAVATTL